MVTAELAFESVHIIGMQIQYAAIRYTNQLLPVKNAKVMLHSLQQNYSREIHPGAPPFSRMEGFSEIPGKH